MKTLLCLLLIFISFLAKAQSDEINMLALKNGCRILVSPPSFYTSNEFTAKIDPWTIQALLDETSTFGWCSAANVRSPYRFIFELSEDFILDRLYFDTQGQRELGGICSREVQVEISSVGPDKGFLNMGFFTLKEYAVTEFKINPIKVRWIKLSILSNYGNPQYTQLQEFKAFGNFAEKNYNAANIIGLWDTNFEWVSIKKNDNGYIYGCYKWEEGELYSGEIRRRNFNFKWSQKGDGLKGWAILTINKEGTRLNGIWGFNENHNQFGFWEFKKNSDKPYPCDIDVQVKNIKPKFPISYPASVEVKNEQGQQYLKVRIQDGVTGNPLNAEILLSNDDSKISGGTAANGLYQTKVPTGKEMKIEAKMKGYLSITDKLISDISGTDTILKIINMNKLEVGKAVILHNIIFHQSSYELLKESYPDLDKIVQMMADNPKMEIEILGHTDNQGDPKKNLELSEERVSEVKKYLMSKGISENRIKGIGFGGTRPIASNDKEDSRKMNRRVEFKIVRM
jgi:outer membrane protein OmpA-like peptidoglycan-associated protein